MQKALITIRIYNSWIYSSVYFRKAVFWLNHQKIYLTHEKNKWYSIDVMIRLPQMLILLGSKVLLQSKINKGFVLKPIIWSCWLRETKTFWWTGILNLRTTFFLAYQSMKQHQYWNQNFLMRPISIQNK